MNTSTKGLLLMNFIKKNFNESETVTIEQEESDCLSNSIDESIDRVQITGQQQNVVIRTSNKPGYKVVNGVEIAMSSSEIAKRKIENERRFRYLLSTKRSFTANL